VKISASSQEPLRRLLLDRHTEIKTTWKNPERYAEHIVPPRLHWLLDLGLLDLKREKNSITYKLTGAGQRFMEALPKFSSPPKPEVTNQWLGTRFFSEVGPILISADHFRQWDNVDDTIRMEVCRKYLSVAFSEFRKTSLPKISLTQGLMYLCLRFATDSHLLANPQDLVQWFRTPRILGSYKYEVRTSARENEAYFVMRHA